MALIGTEGFRYSHLVKNELWETTGFCHDYIVVNEASAKNYVVGTVLGVVSANGKAQIAVETSVSGSKTPAYVVIEEVAIPATTDTKVRVIARGPSELSKGALVLDATYNDATKLGVAYAALEAKFIKLLEAV